MIRVRGTCASLATLCVFGALLLAVPSTAAAKDCGDRYGQIRDGRDPGALILKRRDISCPAVRKLGRALLRDAPLPSRIDGFYCRYIAANAGGGEARCTSGRRLVLFGFE